MPKKEEVVEKRKPLINYDKEITPVYFKKRSEPVAPQDDPRNKKNNIKPNPKVKNNTSQTEIKKPTPIKNRDTQTEIKKPTPIESKDTQTLDINKPNETKITQTDIKKSEEETNTQDDPSNKDATKRTNLNGASFKKQDTLPRSSGSLVSVNKKGPRVQSMPTNPFEEIWDINKLDPDFNKSELESEREKEREREKAREADRLRQLEVQRERERNSEFNLDFDSEFEIDLVNDAVLKEKSINRSKRAFGGSSINKRVSTVKPA